MINESGNGKVSTSSINTIDLSNNIIRSSQIDLEEGSKSETSVRNTSRIELLNSTDNNNKLIGDNECIGLLALLSIFLLTVGLIICVVCYYVFGIKFLVEDKDKNDECNSEIWDFVLTGIIMSAVMTSLSLNFNSKEDLKLIVSVLAGLISFGIGIWGLEICLNENCDEIENSNLFKFAYVVSIIDIIVGGIIVLIIIFGFFSSYFDNQILQ